MDKLINIKNNNRFNIIFIVGCFVIVAWLCIAQIIGSSFLILPCLACYILFSVWACSKGFTLSVLMFFLPWSPVLKLNIGSVSFFTLALLCIALYLAAVKRVKFNLYHIVCGVILMVLTLLPKMINGSQIESGYILFIFLLIFFPLIIEDEDLDTDFYRLTVHFALGIISAALSAKILGVFPNIAKFIDLKVMSQFIRSSGFYGDANFYAAHISACIAGVLLLLLNEKVRSRIIGLIVLIPFLLYCGFISASKTFLIVLIISAVVWLCLVIVVRKQPVGKVLLITGMAALVIFIFSSTVFQELLQVMKLRFSYNSNASDITTGRTDLWMNYIKELLSNIDLLLLGKGFTNVKLDGKASHNTLLQALFQFGVIGTAVLITWFVQFIRHINRKSEEKPAVSSIILLCIGSLLPWMALDMLFFDERFLIPAYICIGAIYKTKLNQDE